MSYLAFALECQMRRKRLIRPTIPRFPDPLGIYRQRLFYHIQRYRLRQAAVHTGLQTPLLLFSQRISSYSITGNVSPN
ncbi:Uncharacterised protein [Escherichia coli]|uniref:Uncharacterized protein n=1 Tax=Escherichia coli TaxID=562 RepID=A0A376L8W3_ECOLX|nr:Uncharacterised protein [Escherichia coli]